MAYPAPEGAGNSLVNQMQVARGALPAPERQAMDHGLWTAD